MGTCWNCDTQLSLDKEQTNCDNCGEVISYNCNSCATRFEIKSKQEKLPECPFCGFFKCSECGVCSWNCKRFEWEKVIIKKLLPEINQSAFPNLPEKVREIVNYIEEQKISIDRMNCPERGVPVSYAKNRIKSLLAKFEGFRVKDKEDRDAFLKRFKEITDKEIGEELTVSQSREKGSYGQEYRDAFNLAVCFGKFKIEKRKHKDSDNQYEVFIRCEKGHCKFLDVDNLIITYCPSCKTTYPRGTKLCSKCPPKKQGKNKGNLLKLKERLSNKDSCQCYRGNFVKI